MFTFSLLYTLVYIQLLILIFIFFSLYLNVVQLQNYTLSLSTLFIINYLPYANQFTLLFLLLSGLPPVTFFLIKLSFLIKIFSTLSILIQIFFFINFLIGMLFYLQIFNVTLKNFYQTNLLLNIKSNNYSILLKNQLDKQETHYTFWLAYVLFVSFNIVALVFYFDIYIIFFSFF